MKPMMSSLSVLAAVFVLAAPTASAMSCSQQAADLQKRQAAAQKMADARLALVDEVEAAGDAWENAESLRNYGEAAKADAAKSTYETLKADLYQKETSLQAQVTSLNREVAAYNAKCVKN